MRHHLSLRWGALLLLSLSIVATVLLTDCQATRLYRHSKKPNHLQALEADLNTKWTAAFSHNGVFAHGSQNQNGIRIQQQQQQKQQQQQQQWQQQLFDFDGLRDAKDPCMNGGHWNANRSACICPEGWIGDYCSSPGCPNGKGPSAETHWACICDEGWDGLNCESCTTNTSCTKYVGEDIETRCDTSAVIAEKKSWTCKILDESFKPLIGPNGTMLMNCQINTSQPMDQQNGTCNAQVWTWWPCDSQNYTCPFEIFYCNLFGCRMSMSAGKVFYDCDTSACDCTYHFPCPEILAALLHGMTGHSQITCDYSGHNCNLHHDQFEPIFHGDCESGECVYANKTRPVPPPPPKQDNTALIVSVIAASILGVAMLAFLVDIFQLYRHITRKRDINLALLSKKVTEPATLITNQQSPKFLTQPIVVSDTGTETDSVKAPLLQQRGISNYTVDSEPIVAIADSQGASSSVSVGPEAQQSPKSDSLTFHNVSYSVGRLNLLHQISGAAHSGQILAVIGASGSGKTTLLDILANRKTQGIVQGDICFNGVPISESRSYRHAKAYVIQEDCLMSTLSVRESLMISAQLRVAGSHQEKSEAVDHVISELKLEQVENSRIGGELERGISGGERRRVMIGMELITSPRVLLLDEPTSGLDSFSAYSVIETLSRLAREENKIVIFSIHQPTSSIFRLFDQILLVSKGETVYFGPANTATDYFSSCGFQMDPGFNPADFMLDVVSSATHVQHRNLVAHYKQSTLYEQLRSNSAIESQPRPQRFSRLRNFVRESLSPSSSTTRTEPSNDSPVPSNPNLEDSNSIQSNRMEFVSEKSPEGAGYQIQRQLIDDSGAADERHVKLQMLLNDIEKKSATEVSFWHRFRVLCVRCFINFVRSPSLMRMQYGIHIVMGVLLGFVYFQQELDLIGTQNRSGAFFIITAMLALSCLSSLDIFVRERAIYVRERANGYYGTTAYFFSKVLFDFLPLRVLPPMLLGAICYWMIGLRPTAFYFMMFLIILVLFNLAAAALCMAIGSCIPSVGQGNLLVSIVLLFGMLFSGWLLNKDAMPVYLQWTKYASFFSFGFEALMINELHGQTVLWNPKDFPALEISGDSVLKNLGMDPKNFYPYIGALAGMIALFLAMSLLLLKFFVREKR